MQKITPFLWFDGNAEEAAEFYVSVFKKAKVTGITRAGEAKRDGKVPVMSVTFRLEGQDFMAMNGGPRFKFTEAISLFVDCKTQKEIDALSKKLTKGGSQQPCGWVKDQFGLSWQIVPRILGDLLHGKDRDKAGRVMQAMMGMTKLDIEGLKAAAKGKNKDKDKDKDKAQSTSENAKRGTKNKAAKKDRKIKTKKPKAKKPKAKKPKTKKPKA